MFLENGNGYTNCIITSEGAIHASGHERSVVRMYGHEVSNVMRLVRGKGR